MQGGGIKIIFSGIHRSGVIVMPGHVVIVESDRASPWGEIRLSAKLEASR